MKREKSKSVFKIEKKCVTIRRIQKCVVEIRLKHKTSKHFSTNNR